MVNLFLVVIATQFSETKRRETEKIAEERKRYKSSTTLTSTKTESDGCYNQLLKYVIHLVRRRYRQAKRAYNSWKEKRRKNNSESEVNDTNMADIRLNVFGNHIHCEPCYHVIALMESSAAPIASPEPSDIDSVSYIGLPRYLNASPRFFRRSGRTSPLPEPRIIISGGQDETSFYSPACTDSSSNNLSSQQNGGLKVTSHYFLTHYTTDNHLFSSVFCCAGDTLSCVSNQVVLYLFVHRSRKSFDLFPHFTFFSGHFVFNTELVKPTWVG